MIAGFYTVQTVTIEAPRERVFTLLQAETTREVTACEPPRHIAFTWRFNDADQDDPGTHVGFDLRTDGSATFVRVTHAGFSTQTVADRIGEEWAARLRAVKRAAEDGD